MAEILIIDDDPAALLVAKKALEPEHKITTCPSLSEARKNLENRDFHLVLLDVRLPDGSGFEFFNDFKKDNRFENVPVLFVTGASTVADQVLGLSLGAEDYIVKPVFPMLLQARVDSKVQKYQKLAARSQTFISFPLTFEVLKQRAYICSGSVERELELTSLEFKLLLHFARRVDQVFTRDQLMTSIWGENVHIMDRTIDTHICHLRTKLKGSEITLEAVHGTGYRLTRIKTTLSQAG